MSTPLTTERIAELKQIAEKATPGPYFVDADIAEDCPDHARSGLALVDTGRSNDWPIARLCEWPTAKHIAAFDPETCLQLLNDLVATRQHRNDLIQELERVNESARD